MVNDEGVFSVEGVLGVSRAIGDHYLKPYVCSTPDLFKLKRTKDDFVSSVGKVRLSVQKLFPFFTSYLFPKSIMLRSSDGLWEDLEPSDCMQILKRELKNGKTLEACATAMVDLVCFAFALLA